MNIFRNLLDTFCFRWNERKLNLHSFREKHGQTFNPILLPQLNKLYNLTMLTELYQGLKPISAFLHALSQKMHLYFFHKYKVEVETTLETKIKGRLNF